MKTQDFIELFIEELEIEDTEITIDTKLVSIQEWDSMGVMIAIGLIADNFNINLKSSDLKGLTTIKDLMERVGVENFTD